MMTLEAIALAFALTFALIAIVYSSYEIMKES